MKNYLIKISFILALFIPLQPILFPADLFSADFFSAQADDFFEGILTFRMGTHGKQTDMKYFMKGSKMRMQVEIAPGMESSGIADYEKKKIYMLLGHGMYTEMEIDDKVLGGSADKALEKSTLVDTGETADILGYKCTKLINQKEKEITEIWIAKGFGKFYQPEMGQQNSTFMALQKKFDEEKAFPFRIVTYSPDKKELFRMEVINVEKKNLEDSLFQIPPGSKKIPMAGAFKNK
jgi:hypothetical protein